MASSDRVRQLFSGNSRTAGHAAESSAVPTDPNAARFSGVSGTRSSDPSAECTASGRDRPVTRDCPGRPACSSPAAASTAACSSSSGAGPSALRQSRQARSDAGRHGLDHGTSARSPASAMITSPGCASGHQRLQHEHPDHERRGQQPLPLALDEPRVQHRVLRDAADHARPGLAVQPVLQRAERRVPARAARRPDLPLPRHHRRRDRHDLQEHDRLARPDLLRARHHQRRPVPVLHRQPRSSAARPGTAAAPRPSPRPEDPPHQRKHWQDGRRQGKKTQRLLAKKGDLDNPSSSRSLTRPHRKPGNIPQTSRYHPQ